MTRKGSVNDMAARGAWEDESREMRTGSESGDSSGLSIDNPYSSLLFNENQLCYLC